MVRFLSQLGIFIFSLTEAISDLRVAKSFILRVNEGPKKGMSWLVDERLNTTAVTKLSGTNQAGVNQTLLGCTADALAHYSLLESEGALVLTDIQGGFNQSHSTQAAAIF